MSRSLMIALLSIFLSQMNAQKNIPSPVKWDFQLVKISDTSYEFLANATIAPKWNIYSKDMGEDGPIPTSITFELPEGVSFEGKLLEKGDIKSGYDELFDMQVMKIKDKVSYVQKIKVTKVTQPLKGQLVFMCCDHERCLPPTNVPFELTF